MVRRVWMSMGVAVLVASWACVARAGVIQIELAKTVGTNPAACATTDFITVTAGTNISYCYTLMNMSVVTLTSHDLSDSNLGMLLPKGFQYPLLPYASKSITVTTQVTQTGRLMNTATWTARDAMGLAITATDIATVDVLPGTENGGAGPAGCSDGRDNDGDGLVDCGDPDCLGIPPCIAPAPALGSSGLMLAAIVLLTVGGAALTLRRRTT